MTITDSALLGIQRAELKVDTIAQKVANATSTNDQVTDSIDFSEAAVQMMMARTEHSANLKVLETAGEMQKHVLDILA